MADVPAFYGWLQKQITMKTDRLPPRERGLKPTHFIEVWKGLITGNILYGFPSLDNYTANRPAIRPISNLREAIGSTTVAIFKIYPKHK